MTRRPGVTRFPLWLPVALLALCAACALPSPTLPPPAGRVEEGRFIHSGHRFYLRNPGGWKAVLPREREDFHFGWAGGDSRVLLWLMPGEGGPGEAGRALAKSREWALSHAKAISWQGFPAWDAQIFQPGLNGRLRVVGAPGGIIAVAALAPPADEGKEEAKLAGLIEGLRLIPPGDVMHVVRYPNESLSIIAMWYADSGSVWPKIKEHNGLATSDLVLGQVILIPADMAVRLSPLPAWAVPPLPGKPDPKKGEPPQPDQEPDPGIKLMPIGPK